MRAPPLQCLSAVVGSMRELHWPGNIRELENFVKRYLVLGDESAAIAELQRDSTGGLRNSGSAPVEERQSPPQPDLKEMVRTLKNGAEMEAIAQVLEETAWNRKRAAD